MAHEEMTGGHKRRNVMQEFTINEISFVDRPAQEGALAAILKHADIEPDRDAFPRRVEEIAARDKINRLQAMQKARRESPTEFESYQGLSASQVTVEKQSNAVERGKWNLLVDGIVEREGVTRDRAMSIARRRNPVTYEAVYGH